VFGRQTCSPNFRHLLKVSYKKSHLLPADFYAHDELAPGEYVRRKYHYVLLPHEISAKASDCTRELQEGKAIIPEANKILTHTHNLPTVIIALIGSYICRPFTVTVRTKRINGRFCSQSQRRHWIYKGYKAGSGDPFFGPCDEHHWGFLFDAVEMEKWPRRQNIRFRCKFCKRNSKFVDDGDDWRTLQCEHQGCDRCQNCGKTALSKHMNERCDCTVRSTGQFVLKANGYHVQVAVMWHS
jgi:hypothetical protein